MQRALLCEHNASRAARRDPSRPISARPGLADAYPRRRFLDDRRLLLTRATVYPLLKYYLKRALTLPPHQTAKKAARFASELVRQRIAASRERNAPTYCHVDEGRPLARRIAITADDVPDDLAAALPRIAERYLTHEFDLLGSGWIEVRYGADCPGLEQHKYPAGPRITPDARGRWLSDDRQSIQSGKGCEGLAPDLAARLPAH